MEVRERRIVEHCVEHCVLGGKNTARFLSAFLSYNSLSCRYKFQHACSEKQSLSLNVPWQMDLSSKAKITHPLVLVWKMRKRLKDYCTNSHSDQTSGRSRPSDKAGGGGGHPDPEIRGGNRSPKKIFFQPFRASFWSKKKWGRRPGPPGPSAGSATAYGPAFFF